MRKRSDQGRVRSQFKSTLMITVFITIIGALFLLNRVLPLPNVLEGERRQPAAFPQFTADTLLTTEFMDSFGKYVTDNFIFRDTFRMIRSASVFYVFMQTDKDGIYYNSDAGIGKFEKTKEKSLRQVGSKIAKLVDRLPDIDVYYSFIPDKSIYAGWYMPGFDSRMTHRILEEELGDRNIKYIDLTDVLSATAYYKTDLHWDQSKLGGVTEALGIAMGFSERLNNNFNFNTAGPFHGVYKGQLALPHSPDEMCYLTSNILSNTVVKYMDIRTNEWTLGTMYELESVTGHDPYDIFLKGVQPLIIIDNRLADTERQLYIFRDSFSSSLAPLLTSAYARITLIDMRYIDSRVLEDYISFANENADVLFLYSSQILNNPDILQIN